MIRFSSAFCLYFISIASVFHLYLYRLHYKLYAERGLSLKVFFLYRFLYSICICIHICICLSHVYLCVFSIRYIAVFCYQYLYSTHIIPRHYYLAIQMHLDSRAENHKIIFQIPTKSLGTPLPICSERV